MSFFCIPQINGCLILVLFAPYQFRLSVSTTFLIPLIISIPSCRATPTCTSCTSWFTFHHLFAILIILLNGVMQARYDCVIFVSLCDQFSKTLHDLNHSTCSTEILSLCVSTITLIFITKLLKLCENQRHIYL